MTKRWKCFLSVLLLGLSGCVTQSQDGSSAVYAYEWWVTALWVVVGIAVGPIGWKLRGGRYGWALLIACPVFVLGVAPTMWLTSVRVNDDGFQVHNGIWGATANSDVKFADVSGVRLTSETTRSRRGGKRTNYFLNFDRRSGQSEKVSIGNDVLEAGGLDILERLAKRGITVIDQSQAQ
jgi:hypothetical protein